MPDVSAVFFLSRVGGYAWTPLLLRNAIDLLLRGKRQIHIDKWENVFYEYFYIDFIPVLLLIFLQDGNLTWFQCSPGLYVQDPVQEIAVFKIPVANDAAFSLFNVL